MRPDDWTRYIRRPSGKRSRWQCARQHVQLPKRARSQLPIFHGSGQISRHSIRRRFFEKIRVTVRSWRKRPQWSRVKVSWEKASRFGEAAWELEISKKYFQNGLG